MKPFSWIYIYIYIYMQSYQNHKITSNVSSVLNQKSVRNNKTFLIYVKHIVLEVWKSLRLYRDTQRLSNSSTRSGKKLNVFMWVQSCSCNHILCKKLQTLVPVITYITPMKKNLLKLMITYDVRVITCRPEFHLRWALWWVKIIKYRRHNVMYVGFSKSPKFYQFPVSPILLQHPICHKCVSDSLRYSR